MALIADLEADAMAAAMPGRPVRLYPALVSTEAVALDWARGDAPSGAVVAAGYQISPRGRAGWPWKLEPGTGVVFSMIVRVRLPLAREGWLYTVASCALADVVGVDARIRWPDEVYRADLRICAVGIQADLSPRQGWALLTVLLADARPPRAPRIAEAVAAIEARLAQDPETVMADHRSRLTTVGTRLRARLLPSGDVSGTAIGTLRDGALLLDTPERRRIAVLPQGLADWQEVALSA
jgi:BirA family biotin operon repressor/biotin-[acetyl-CoA-carboxylase] ligase